MKNGNFWFYLGAGFLAVVVGVLVGISSSPVVAVVIPLMFALLSAGGAIFVVWGKGADGGKAAEREARTSFLGKQMLVFAICMLLGLWIGVGAKLNPTVFWSMTKQPTSTVVGLPYTDIRVLAGLLEIDGRLKKAGLSFDERKKIIGELHAAMLKRVDTAGALSQQDADALNALLNSGNKSGDKDEDEKPRIVASGDSSEEKYTG